MIKTPVTQLKVGFYYTSKIYIDNKFLLLPEDVPYTKEIEENLKKWKITTVYSDVELIGVPEAERTVPVSHASSITVGVEEDQGRKAAEVMYKALLDYTDTMFREYIKNGRINLNQITEKLKDIINEVKHENRFILRVVSFRDQGKDYLVTHSVKTTILALAIGEKLKLPQHKLVELGLSCLLHEIGLLKLPPKLYNGTGTITDEEKMALSTHTILSFRTLKPLSVSRDVLLGVLEHHERMDGEGYPQKLTGDKISLFGKIIAIACSFDAQISKRPFRDGKNPHSSLLNMIRGMGNQYDEKLLKIFISLVSVYPVGSILLLESNSYASVIDCDPDNPKYPILQQLTDPEGNILSTKPIIETSEKNPPQIQKVLSISEAEELEQKLFL